MSAPRLHTASAVGSSTKPSDETLRPRLIQPPQAASVDVNLHFVTLCDAANILPRPSGSVSAHILSIFKPICGYAH